MKNYSNQLFFKVLRHSLLLMNNLSQRIHDCLEKLPLNMQFKSFAHLVSYVSSVADVHRATLYRNLTYKSLLYSYLDSLKLNSSVLSSDSISKYNQSNKIKELERQVFLLESIIKSNLFMKCNANNVVVESPVYSQKYSDAIQIISMLIVYFNDILKVDSVTHSIVDMSLFDEVVVVDGVLMQAVIDDLNIL